MFTTIGIPVIIGVTVSVFVLLSKLIIDSVKLSNLRKSLTTQHDAATDRNVASILRDINTKTSHTDNNKIH